MIPMTTDNEQLPAPSNLTPSDNNTPDSFSLFIHEWKIFYHKLVYSATYQSTLSQAKPFDHDDDAIDDEAIMTAADTNATKPFNSANDDNDATVTNASDIITTNNEQLHAPSPPTPLANNNQASFSHILQEPVVFTFEPFNHNTDAVNNATVTWLSNQQAKVINMHDIVQSQPLDHNLPLDNAIERFDYKKCLNELATEWQWMEQLWPKLAIDKTIPQMEQPTPATP